MAGCGIESALAAEQPLAADGRRWHSGRRPQLKRGVMPTDRKMMPIKEIEQAIKRFEAVSWSSSGYPLKGGREAEGSTDAGWVRFGIERSELGWRTLEFLAWTCTDMTRAGERLEFFPTSPPPYLNTPGESLGFVIECYPLNGDHSERFKKVAEFINSCREQYWPQCRGGAKP